jgi:glycyl-tRNA synthetase
VVTTRDDIVGLDCSILMNPRVWEASGHVQGFTDPLVDCRECKARFRADQIFVATVNITRNGQNETVAVLSAAADAPEEAAATLGPAAEKIAKKRGGQLACAPDALPTQPFLEVADKSAVPCPACNKPGALTEARQFNMMFKTHVGALEDSSSVAYLRPETAQGIFANFKNVLDTSRIKIPFGIAQIGKAFRNEINPRNYTFRSREFEQMEIEYFTHPNEAAKWYEHWREARFNWYVGLGLQSSRLRLRDHEPDELAHYARSCADVEYHFPFGVAELEGVANRTDFDLMQHQKHSGKDMAYFDEETKERYVPHVIEPSAGVDRAALAFLCEGYHEEEVRGERRVVLRFHPRLAPMKAAVLPLVRKDGMPERALGLYRDLKRRLNVFYDDKGAIGRRYRRQDEAGTPFCVTIDGQTAQDSTVTIRDRDSMEQVRVQVDQVLSYLLDRLRAAGL